MWILEHELKDGEQAIPHLLQLFLSDKGKYDSRLSEKICQKVIALKMLWHLP